MDMNPNENLPASVPGTPTSDSSTSDSEACNTATSRVHFGPLKSPEKKFVPIVSRRQTLHPAALNSPLRRSAKLPFSDVAVPLYNKMQRQTDEEYNSDDNPSRSRSGTPDNDPFPPDGEHLFVFFVSFCW